MSFKDFFYFNKSDRKALLFLLLLGVGATILFYVFSDPKNIDANTPIHDTVFAYRDVHVDRYGQQPAVYYRVEGRQIELFPFDPNTADSTALLRLGLQPWQVRNIYKYRAAGGVYRQRSDFARLYGLTQKQYRTLEPYIHIGSDYHPAAEAVASANKTAGYGRDTLRFPVKIKSSEHISVNTADTNLLKKVPGIGSYYARQIIRYRTRLGGFYSTQQLLEIEDFPEESLPYFRISKHDTEQIQRLFINRLSIHQLKRHPYIGYYRARAIVDYRRLKGPIHRWEDLSMLPDFTPDVIARLSPYVSFSE